MSDENLKNDRFFHNTIMSTPERMIHLDVLMNCKKIKELNPTEEELISAIKASPLLEVQLEKRLFGRVNKFLPVLREKKIYVTLNRKYEWNENEIKHGENFIIFVPVIVSFEAHKKIFFKDKEMMRRLQKALGIEVPYAKVNRKKGVVIFNEFK